MFMLSSQEDIEDFTMGCCFFGTGGGGNTEFGQKMLLEVHKAGKEIRIISVTELQNEEWIACPYLMGTSGPDTEENKNAKWQHGLQQQTISNMPRAAIELLLKHNQESKKLSAVIPYEIGAAATASAVATGAWLNLPTIDADFVGRSVPEIVQMIPVVHGIDLCPIASCDAYGNEVIIHKTINKKMTERLGKAIALSSFGLVGQATLLKQIKDLKQYLLTGTLSKALAVGQAIRKHQNNLDELISKLTQIASSKLLFEGEISKFNDGEKDGYYVGDIEISGTGQFNHSQLKIWFKNENIISWLNGTLYLTCPDLISIIDKSTSTPVVNNQLHVGLKVVVIGTPCHPAWKNKNALKALEPNHFGFEFDAKFL
jgi:DUF917 family protein